MKNQARVYEAEQAEIAERKKTAARLQEIKTAVDPDELFNTDPQAIPALIA